EIVYINLAARPDRNGRFLRANAGIADFRRTEAVAGAALRREDLVRDGVIAEPTPHFTAGAVGNALSPRRLWGHCAAGNAVLTLAEDDAVFNRHFSTRAPQLLAQLPPGWDLILWGWNFDSLLRVKLLGELQDAFMYFNRPSLGERLAEFPALDYPVQALRLATAFGLVSYSLSPSGARRLLQRCFPLRDEAVPVPGLRAVPRNTSLDVTMNKHYPALAAYACFPPLVWTENDPTSSDVVPRR